MHPDDLAASQGARSHTIVQAGLKSLRPGDVSRLLALFCSGNPFCCVLGGQGSAEAGLGGSGCCGLGPNSDGAPPPADRLPWGVSTRLNEQKLFLCGLFFDVSFCGAEEELQEAETSSGGCRQRASAVPSPLGAPRAAPGPRCFLTIQQDTALLIFASYQAFPSCPNTFGLPWTRGWVPCRAPALSCLASASQPYWVHWCHWAHWYCQLPPARGAPGVPGLSGAAPNELLCA